ncbi:MAG: hypothetical protein AAF443_04770 [Chlamydiota bacterium]
MKIKLFFFGLVLMCCFASSIFCSSEEGKYIFLKSRHLGELYLTVHDDVRHDSSFIHGRYVHARRKDEKVTGTLRDCSTWFLQLVEGAADRYYIYIQSKLMGKLYLAVHRALDRDKRDNVSTYVHARKEKNLASTWHLEPAAVTGFYIVLHGKNSCLTVHHSTKNDLRDETSLYVHSRHKDFPVTTSQTDCSMWYVEKPAQSDADSHRLTELENRVKKLEEIIGVPVFPVSP